MCICISYELFLITFPENSPIKPMESNASESYNFTCSETSLQNPHNLTEGCMVQYGRPANYGVIKWIGTFPNDHKTIYAGLVMVKLKTHVP